MNRIKVMVNGIPGNMAVSVAQHILDDNRFDLVPGALTGPEIIETEFSLDTTIVRLIPPEKREVQIAAIMEKEGKFISVDYTHPSAVNENADFFCRHGLPFVMGTTGGDRNLLEEAVCASSISSVIAPNMAKQIVGFQAMMAYAANMFPNLFQGYSLEIKESHQRGKADTSGTAKAMASYFNQLGIPFSENDIIKERRPETQKTEWGIPEKYLQGHGWHTYRLNSTDETVSFKFTHNVNGREIYAKGTLDAVMFLDKKVNEGTKGSVFTMIDVLKDI
ncbi:MAG: dihydrodipicolinate reductase [Desulfobacterales bacterium]|jgi:4-hydroxy-tetrahydrodipicolinate reductase|nr:dihydrodipicolinate reductase [Desulfobacter sp.]MDP6394125.1 dihydrodipicolinate reductase [Desulfobacterales bacterium]MDP6684217.1 dihydrodipicolinate reductase [Desulfobacterales bacterium]MDP6806986.1 dihydrodipicolinate reductase [Desulfobacterales bacterium]|tara:strand:+ start:28784 stop:29614 length:831 start_codon:yes stop_codon:yes gene_type:complete